jgi:nanoRNase/pAp phosphatase (c-di-AMP/oligoRNAs hydrolase)
MNLGVFAAELAKKHNGFGGGHVSRAGATVPTGEMDGFINDMREALIA